LNKGSVVFAFLAGVVTGVVASWKALKKKYERIAQQEINSVKEKFAKRYSSKESTTEFDDDAEVLYSQYKTEIELYASQAEEKTEEGVEYMPRPRVITPDELGENDEYEIISLSLYSDGVLADSITDEPIEDIENTVGQESLHHIGDYEPDCVHVQNDRLKTYYEVLLDAREFNCTPIDE
jgi:hypothetical protein